MAKEKKEKKEKVELTLQEKLAHLDIAYDQMIIIEMVWAEANNFFQDEVKPYPEKLREQYKQELLERKDKNLGGALRFVSEELRKDEELVLEIITQDPTAIKYADLKLRKSKSFIKEAIKTNPNVYHHLSKRQRKNHKVALAAIESGVSLKEIETLKEIERNTLAFLDWWFLPFIAPLIAPLIGGLIAFETQKRRAKKIVRTAIAKDWKNFEDAPKTMKRDRRFVLSLLKDYPQLLPLVSPHLLRKDNFIVDAIKRNPEVGLYADEAIEKIRVYESRKAQYKIDKKERALRRKAEKYYLDEKERARKLIFAKLKKTEKKAEKVQPDIITLNRCQFEDKAFEVAEDKEAVEVKPEKDLESKETDFNEEVKSEEVKSEEVKSEEVKSEDNKEANKIKKEKEAKKQAKKQAEPKPNAAQPDLGQAY